ncbi:hypothetical protein COOONC_18874 [Cooperia oncophora]
MRTAKDLLLAVCLMTLVDKIHIHVACHSRLRVHVSAMACCLCNVNDSTPISHDRNDRTW